MKRKMNYNTSESTKQSKNVVSTRGVAGQPKVVAGNLPPGCYLDDGSLIRKLIVSAGYSCEKWYCRQCGHEPGYQGGEICAACGVQAVCSNCAWMRYQKGIWMCGNWGNAIFCG